MQELKQESQGQISPAECKIVNEDGTEKFKSKKLLGTKLPGNLGYYKKKPNLKIIGMEEGKKTYRSKAQKIISAN